MCCWLLRDDALSVTKRRIRKERFSMKDKRMITLLAGGAVFLLAAFAVAGCGGGGKSSGSSGPPKTADGRSATVGVSNEGLGKILVDSRGRTVYLFSKDSGTTSECSGACAVNWPPLRATGKPTIGSGAKASLVSTSTRSDGARQVTYNGHPLYRFEGDKKSGDTNGEGLTAFGGSWYALSPAGNQVSGQAPSSGGGGGYGY
jgi:predicted lipoprotein with Yx(FWY)xxD motif